VCKLFSPIRIYERTACMVKFFENGVLSRIFGPKREEDGFLRKLHNDELPNMYSLPNVVKVIKSRKMRWAGHGSCKDKGRSVYRVLFGRPNIEK